MFTGLIQKKGTFSGFSDKDGGMVMDVLCPPWPNDPVIPGESIAVQGACLTVVSVSEAGFSADVLQETLDSTVLGALRYGDPLNLERALKLSDRLGGHIVAGHVDGKGTVTGVRRSGRDWVLRIACAPEEAKYIVRKGSVALNGVSLTVSDLPSAHEFEVNIIPTTWHETSLMSLKSGNGVNIETDIIGRHIERLAAFATPEEGNGLTLERLTKAGFYS